MPHRWQRLHSANRSVSAAAARDGAVRLHACLCRRHRPRLALRDSDAAHHHQLVLAPLVARAPLPDGPRRGACVVATRSLLAQHHAFARARLDDHLVPAPKPHPKRRSAARPVGTARADPLDVAKTRFAASGVPAPPLLLVHEPPLPANPPWRVSRGVTFPRGSALDTPCTANVIAGRFHPGPRLSPPKRRTNVLDFDHNRTWGPRLTATLGGLLTDRALDKLVNPSPEYVEDASELLFSYADRVPIVDATLAWIRSTSIAAYHGGRLNRSEVESIRARGLLPLEANARHARLTRALSPHPRWGHVAHRLDTALRDYGPGERPGAGRGRCI